MNRNTYLRTISFFILIFFAVTATGCGTHSNHKATEPDVGHVHTMPGRDVRETTASSEQLPRFLDGKPAEMVNIYRLAADYADLLEWIPCYCGCGESAGHRNNLQCFVNERREDGTIVWDDHGTRCGVCLDIAFQSAKLQREGQSVKDIRTWVDARYSALNVEPTSTPLPQ